MAYEDFLHAFAREQGLANADDLCGPHAQKYAFAIKTRETALPALSALEAVLPKDVSNLRALHIGCGYGSLLIELAKRGATCVGVDTSEPKLELARINGQDEAEVTFLKSYIAVRSHVAMLREHGPFDLIVVDGAFERTYDTVKLVSHLRSLAADDAVLSARIFNPLATSAVLADPVKKKLGTTLLPPDKIFEYTGTNYTMFFRALEHYEAILAHFEFKALPTPAEPTDASEEQMRAHISKDLERIRKEITDAGATGGKVIAAVRTTCREYIEEVKGALSQSNSFYMKYRFPNIDAAFTIREK